MLCGITEFLFKILQLKPKNTFFIAIVIFFRNMQNLQYLKSDLIQFANHMVLLYYSYCYCTAVYVQYNKMKLL